MKLEKHVLYAIEDFEQNRKDSALMHACIAIDGTAKNLFPNQLVGKQKYKECIRQYWWLIEAFIGAGLNLEDISLNYIALDNGYGKKINNPDLADIVYHIFRCNLAHAKEIPLEYSLLPYSDGEYTWFFDFKKKTLQMPETIIWALLAVSVFSKANMGIKTDGEHYMTWGSKELGLKNFVIKNSWGSESEVRDFLSEQDIIRVKMNF